VESLPEVACSKGCTVSTAYQAMQPIDQGLSGTGLLAQVAVEQVWRSPSAAPQEGIFQRQGVDLSRKTMCGWMGQCAQLVSRWWI